MEPAPRGDVLLAEVRRDLRFWLCIILFFGVFRAILILMFRHHLSPRAGSWELSKAFLGGARFDASVAAYWTLPSLLASLACGFGLSHLFANRVRRALVFSFVFFSLALCIVNAGYFAEFKDNFDQTIYGLLYDNQGAIFNTIWQEYHVIPLLFLLAIGTVLGGRALSAFVRAPLVRPHGVRLVSRRRRAAAAFVIIGLWFFSARGSLGSSPWKYRFASKTTADDFLNKMVLNPYVALKYAVQRHSLFGQAGGWKRFLPDEPIRAAACELFPGGLDSTNLDERLKRVAPGASGPPPKHIFLIVMESYDAWTMLPAYRSLGLSPELGRLAADGIFVKAFVPAGNMTMVSLDTLISGLPGSGLGQSYQVSARRAFPTATAAIFKRLGYTTRFIKGGDPGWNRLGDFARDQGFDEVHSASMIPVCGPPRDWGWGVDDEDMFRYVLGLLSDDRPSFNVIMSVSNHQPHNLDVFSMGYLHREIPPDLAGVYSGGFSMRALGHYWYADRALGRFVAAVREKSPRSLFAVTGDHWSRNFLNDHPTVYERSAVPLVLYGPEVLARVRAPSRMAGAHIDIAPTLVDLAAPAGFQYESFGGNILDPARRPVGYGQFAVVTPGSIFPAGRPEEAQTLGGTSLAGLARPSGFGESVAGVFAMGRVAALPGSPSQAPSAVPLSGAAKFARLSHLQQAEAALGWWRLVEGPSLPPD